MYRLNMPICFRCKLSLPIEEFSKRPNGKPASFCKACQRANGKRHHNANRENYIKARSERSKLELASHKALISELKKAPCIDCGEQHPPWRLEFDHRAGVMIEFRIASSSNFLERDYMRN